MTYLRSFLINLLAIIFISRFAPGIAVPYGASAASWGVDLLFSAIVAFFNASIIHALLFFEVYPSKARIALLGAIVSFGSLIVIALVPYGMEADAGGVAVGGLLIWLVSFVTNYLDMRHWMDTSEKK